MSRTHDVTISAFDLDRIEAELADVTDQRDCAIRILKRVQEQRDRLAEAQNLLKQCLSAMPVGYIPTHTEENLPEMIGDLAKALADETTERENLERELATVTEQRDRLAYALFMCRRELVDVLDDINKERVSYDGDDFHEALRISKEALSAMEGGSDE
jgi:hypothetical protein